MMDVLDTVLWLFEIFLIYYVPAAGLGFAIFLFSRRIRAPAFVRWLVLSVLYGLATAPTMGEFGGHHVVIPLWLYLLLHWPASDETWLWIYCSWIPATLLSGLAVSEFAARSRRKVASLPG